MKMYRVKFEIHIDSNHKVYKTIEVEAGGKKIASLRAMTEMGKLAEYSNYFKNIISVEEM